MPYRTRFDGNIRYRDYGCRTVVNTGGTSFKYHTINPGERAPALCPRCWTNHPRCNHRTYRCYVTNAIGPGRYDELYLCEVLKLHNGVSGLQLRRGVLFRGMQWPAAGEHVFDVAGFLEISSAAGAIVDRQDNHRSGLLIHVSHFSLKCVVNASCVTTFSSFFDVVRGIEEESKPEEVQQVRSKIVVANEAKEPRARGWNESR
ncbi:hypothetical protein M409DRAFT_59743 [Zasmidium cellare ATCC 36951]|uniref:Uncharacterized protein n=1 Tax=Zasmidium cellare ATCC 36951 TaxID=1080233 RepID=A0A6A6C4C9_ZASCE|nr:uncharacterized protein M409DRAFT_59743 [Zasmidium cellare ATCC 36951]KAF2160712.1 hypothetical protein M409DRAFT_59743 [Zasmidium cellare ATCC 36951]